MSKFKIQNKNEKVELIKGSSVLALFENGDLQLNGILLDLDIGGVISIADTPAINTVAENIDVITDGFSIIRVLDELPSVITVAENIDDVVDVSDNIISIQNISNNIDKLTNILNNIDNINVVSNNITSINIVAENLGEIESASTRFIDIASNLISTQNIIAQYHAFQ